MNTRNASILFVTATAAIFALALLLITGLQTVSTSAHTSSQISKLNTVAIATDRNSWTTNYDTLRANTAYSWMDWSVDGCSLPPGADQATLGRSGQFETGCERHDLAWRTLAAIDEGDGDVWNQRNRLVADKKFHSDLNDICNDRYPVIIGSDANDILRASCLGAASVYYRGVRTAHWPPGTSVTQIMLGNTNLETTAESGSVATNAEYIADSTFSNRPLPISYLSFNGNPLAPQNVSRFPTGKAMPVTLTKANLLSTNGTLPTNSTWSHYYRTNQVKISAHYPVIISSSAMSGDNAEHCRLTATLGYFPESAREPAFRASYSICPQSLGLESL